MDDIATWLRARAAEETSNDTAAKFWGAAGLIESLRSENDRLGGIAKSLSAIIDAPDRAEAIIDVIADRDSWRDQCAMRDHDNTRLAKELEEARKALEAEHRQFLAVGNMYVGKCFELNQRRSAAFEEAANIAWSYADTNQVAASIAAAIRHKASGDQP